MKGKENLVDRLAEQATWVARFQGGKQRRAYGCYSVNKCPEVPSPPFRDHTPRVSILSSETEWSSTHGSLTCELERIGWKLAGEDPRGAIVCLSAERAHIILPYHRAHGQPGHEQSERPVAESDQPTLTRSIESVCDLETLQKSVNDPWNGHKQQPSSA